MKKTILVIGLLMSVLFSTGCMTVINDGEVGVKKTLGNYEDEEIGTGVKFYVPLVTWIYKVDVRKAHIEQTISVPSNEGLIVDLDVSVILRVRSDRASEIQQTVYGNIADTLIIPYIRNGIRDIASNYTAEAMYTETGRVEIAARLELYLQDKLNKDIVIEDVLLRNVKLPAKVTEAIELKADAEKKAQAKEFELQAAVKDAEIEVERAKGISEANKIISNSITDRYIQYKFMEGLNDGHTEVIYVPTEANLPILEATRSLGGE